MFFFSAFFLLVGSVFKPRITLAVEVLALRQKLVVLQRSIKRPQLCRRDRFFWVSLSQLWKNWREVLIKVKPETVVKWHREGFRLYWRWKSTAPIGRPKIDLEIRELIRQMSRENPLWGNPRIQSELRLLGFEVAERTVAKYRIKHAKTPSQTWKTFLANHTKQIAGIDFFTVPTIHFRNLYCFVICILREYFDYYHNARPHQSLEKNSPTPQNIETQSPGKVISIPQVGGLHHCYRHAA